MVISILDSWKEFDTNFAIVKTSGGIFTISRGQTSYAVEQAVERFSVIPCRVSQKDRRRQSWKPILAGWKKSNGYFKVFREI